MNKQLYSGVALVFFANALLFVARFVGRTADPHLLFGLSSSFWSGVMMGAGIVLALGGIAWIVAGFAQRRKGN